MTDMKFCQENPSKWTYPSQTHAFFSEIFPNRNRKTKFLMSCENTQVIAEKGAENAKKKWKKISQNPIHLVLTFPQILQKMLWTWSSTPTRTPMMAARTGAFALWTLLITRPLRMQSLIFENLIRILFWVWNYFWFFSCLDFSFVGFCKI